MKAKRCNVIPFSERTIDGVPFSEIFDLSKDYLEQDMPREVLIGMIREQIHFFGVNRNRIILTRTNGNNELWNLKNMKSKLPDVYDVYREALNLRY